jgi:hypothetical protein
MARIPDEEIERLKQEVSLERLAEGQGIELQRHGADLLGRCPFHDDHEPSLVISPKKNLWHCLGACQAGGTVIDWVMRTRGVSFRLAVELLALVQTKRHHDGTAIMTQMVELAPASELFKGRQFDREVNVLCVRWYLSYKLSSRDLVEIMSERSIALAHTTILRWVQRYVPEFEKLWKRYARPVGGSWRCDETYSALSSA